VGGCLFPQLLDGGSELLNGVLRIG